MGKKKKKKSRRGQKPREMCPDIQATLAQGDVSSQGEEAERSSASTGLPLIGSKSQSQLKTKTRKPLPSLGYYPEKLYPRRNDGTEIIQLSHTLRPAFHSPE